MEFKHAFHVFVDNFATTYKLLVYRLVVLMVTIGLGCAVLVPAIGNISHTAQYKELSSAFSTLWSNIIALNLEETRENMQAFRSAYGTFMQMLSDKSWLIATVVVCMCVVLIIDKFFVGVGNYVTGAVVHDKMVMYTRSPFTYTLFRNIKQAVLFALIFAPLTFLYDAVCFLIMLALYSVVLQFLPLRLVKIFLVAILFLVFSAVKYTLTTSWLPALIHAKMTQRQALVYTITRKDKRTAAVLSNALVLKLTILALNVAAGLFTFGAGLLLTLPASSLILVCFSFVNYFDTNKLKYFVDEYTIIGPKRETPVSREEFFKGEDR